MDFSALKGLALLELLAAVGYGILAWGRGNSGTSDTLRWALALYALQWLGLGLYRVFVYPYYVSPLRRVPGPKDGHLFFGQFINMFRAESPVSIYTQWKRQFPGVHVIRYLTLANNEVLVPLTAQGQRHVLQTRCYDFRKPHRWQKMIQEFAGLGIVTLDGEQHKQARRMLASSFAARNIRKLQPVFREKAQQLCLVLGEAVGGTTGVIDAGDTLCRATLDVMGVTTLGVELSHLRDTTAAAAAAGGGCASFHDAYGVILSAGAAAKLLMFANPYVPGGLRWLPLRANREFACAAGWLRRVLAGLVRERRAGVYGGEALSRDLLTYIVEESGPGGAAEGIPEEQFVGHLLQFMAAGHETTATTLAYALLAMAENPHMQDTLRSEIESLYLGSGEPSSADVDGLPYLDNVTKEVLRRYTPATTTHRESATDMVFGGTAVPAGTTFDIIPALTLLDPAIWGSDVDEFDPTRWDRLTDEQASPFVFSIFSNGPRICIGKYFAVLEMKVFLIELVRNFRFLGLEGTYRVAVPGLTMRPTNMRIRLEKIQRA